MGLTLKKGCYVGQENTARIKLKNKLSKRLFPLEIVNGKINADEDIFYEIRMLGKILISNIFPFGIIKTEK